MSKKILQDLVLLSAMSGMGYSTPEEAKRPVADEKIPHNPHTKKWHKNRAREKAARKARKINRK